MNPTLFSTRPSPHTLSKHTHTQPPLHPKNPQAIPGYGEPNCIHLPGSTRVCQVHAIQGDLFVNTTRAAAGVLPLILSSRLAVKDDILVLNVRVLDDGFFWGGGARCLLCVRL